MDLAAGTRIADRYVIDRLLAKGGMGAVYVAVDERMASRVALKVTAAGGAAADELARRFAREARIGHRLGTGRLGFVRASDWGRVDAVQLYLAMDLVEGAKPLDLRQGTLEVRLGRWRRAAGLVQTAHEQGVIHRDLKPANFLQSPDGAIFLTDFGLAKIVSETDASAGDVSLTMTGVGFGTPPYMPPEQLEDAKHADQRADVFALGCMLFEALVGRLPYPGPSPTAIVSAHTKVRLGATSAPRPRDVDESVAAALDHACAYALELDVERRAPSIAALIATMDGAAGTQLEPDAAPRSISGGATTPPAAQPTLSGTPTVPPAASAGPSVPSSSPSAPPRGGPRRALAVTCVLLLVMAAAVAADVAGLRRRLVALIASPSTATERTPVATTLTLVDLSPQEGTLVPALTIDVTGRIDPVAATVRVAGIACLVAADGTFALRRLSLDPGPNQVLVEVLPVAAGQEPLRRTITLTADADDPRLTLESPADGFETADASVVVRGRVDDATAVEVTVEGEIVARVKAGGGAFSTQVALPALGPRVIEVLARDAPGRTTRLTRAVARRAARLDLTLDAPSDDSDTNAPGVRLAGRVTGDAAPGTLEVRVDGAVLRTDASGAFDQTLPRAEGEWALEVVATAAGPAGEPITARAARRVRVDRTAPVVLVIAPADEVSDGLVDVQAEVTDVGAWVDMTLGAGPPTRVHRGQLFNGRVTLAVGTIGVVLVATDAAGNRSETRRRVKAGPWRPTGRPVPWSRGPARLPTGLVRGANDGEYVNQRDGSILLYVPPGSFHMGTDAGGVLDKPVHEVRLTRGYFVGKFEVTWAQYRAFCLARGVQPPSSAIHYQGDFEASDSHPVFHVSWDDAQAYCEWAGLRLPSEAEWEYAARGVDGRTHPWGDQDPGTTRCNLKGNGDGHDKTAPVGSFAAGASAFGAHDMAGNVTEWVQDRYIGPYADGAQTDPSGPASGAYPHRGWRGGAWDDASATCRATSRSGCPPDTRSMGSGLRVVRSAEDPEDAPIPAAWTPGHPLPWSRGPARLPTGVARGATDGEYVNQRDGSILLYVPPGTFRMGSDSGGVSEKPEHEVRLTRGYFVGKYEVTWAQYRAFCRARDLEPPSNVIGYPGEPFEATDHHPVFAISWNHAQAYCQWAGLRLPSEAEWEYAARGSDDRTYPWGDEEPGSTRCNFEGTLDGHLKTSPVGSFAPGASAFGALDMAGNVFEWVQDWSTVTNRLGDPSRQSYPADAQTDPTGATTGATRGCRGGSWNDSLRHCRASARAGLAEDGRNDSHGFRVARSAED